MLDRRWKKTASFADILASLDDPDADDIAAGTGGEQAPTAVATASRTAKKRPRGLLGNISFPWQTTAGELASAPAPAATKPYAEEVAESDRKSHGEALRPTAATLAAEGRAIAKELGLNAGLGRAELARIRREFAKKNHPDQFGESCRAMAERRMSIANMLIDERIRRRRA
ncbi:MAG TPA: hypothetical protein VEK34_08440 [Methylocella sp.]|nr:hypothetical protein [Methylocella sp.]